MATSLDFIEYVCQQISGVGEIRYKKMFGEYMVYIEDKPILLACDNMVYVKQHDCISHKMEGADKGCPYQGAKEHYILDIDQAEFSKEIIELLLPVTPVPKPRKKSAPKPSDNGIDEYIRTCDPEVRAILQELREFIKQHAPQATEKISWSMPTFYQKGNLVHFMAHKKHIGFYPGASGIEHFIPDFDELGLKYSKGAVQFPLGKPLPWDLIRRIVIFRVKENSDQSCNK